MQDADVEDAVQHAFAQLASRDDDVDDVRAWLTTVAFNRLRDRPKLSSLKRDESIHEARLDGGVPVFAALASSDDVEAEVIARADAPRVTAILRAAVATLPDNIRRVVWLRIRHDLTHEEIAARLGIREGACKMRWKRGVDRLRTVLQSSPLAPM